jgi:hypothetical protein
MRCPSCGSEIEAALDFCPSCLGGLVLDPAEARRQLEAAAPEPPGPQQPSEPDVLPAPRELCPRHPDFPLVGTCSRCGSFICVRCAPELATSSSSVCGDCASRHQEHEQARAAPAIEREISAALVLCGLVLIGLFAYVLLTGVSTDLLMVAIGFLPGVLLISLAGVFLLTRWLPVAWVGVVCELGLLFLLMAADDHLGDALRVPPQALLILTLVGLPAFTFYKCLVLRQLRSQAPNPSGSPETSPPPPRA